MTRQITITPPTGLFAAVQVELEDGTVVGAQTCQHQDGTARSTVTANVKSDVDYLLLRWVYEDSSQGTIVTTYGHPRAARAGGR